MNFGLRFRVDGFKNELSYYDENTMVIHCTKKENNYEIFIDTDDLERAIKRYSSIRMKSAEGLKCIYAVGNVRKEFLHGERRRGEMLHRFINHTPVDLITDHKDKNTLNNRKINLRSCTVKENNQNKSNIRANEKSGIRNVRWNEQRNKWVVSMMKDGKRYNFGGFDDLNEAAEVAKKKRKELFPFSVE